MRFHSPFIAGAFLWTMTAVSTLGEPVNFREVSLLVRMQESPAEIGSQITRRKLCPPLTAPEIEVLRNMGTPEQVLQIAQDPRNHLSPEASAQFQRAKAAGLAAVQERIRLQETQPTLTIESPPAASRLNDRNTELKYATEPLAWGSPLSLTKYGGSDTDIFVKSRSGTFYTLEIRKNDRRLAETPPATSPSGNPLRPEMMGRLESRTRIRVEKRNAVRIPTERGDLYLAFVDKASGIHVYILDDNGAAPINTDLLIVSPKKF